MAIHEIHGIANAEKVMMYESKRQRVTVIDADTRVFIELSDPPAAGLSPNQARMIGNQLLAAADRVEKTKAEMKQDAKAKAR